MPRTSLLCSCLVLALAGALSASGCASPDPSSEGEAKAVDRTEGGRYPAHWWTPVEAEDVPEWEILPQAAGPGEVILSKRHELGLLSNFAPTPFTYRGVQYASLEGFWQCMKYPEGPADPRHDMKATWKHTRAEVRAMTGFEAHSAGVAAEANMKAQGVDWVSFERERIRYKGDGQERHYELIVAATWAKVNQNPKVKEVLLSTGDLILKPDHHQEADAKPAWRYFKIYMQVRAELRKAAAAAAANEEEGGRAGKPRK